ncbi:TIGR04282 family arsenosugar biosynthesis glycosyltransferase [Sphingomonas sp. PAMC 26605]|uniref:TIGR04282 family arsenosugar biosynthesis glycosyltransferase n=1 Tax=Sphingomonas sp. PAMC 26605 TaxID=1112214 RepID=UPI00026CAD0D|nr:TIGR04282 family arsenosugar biosynthesis glycosyltransferase [Sphingomonas sp. PAMC 26605]
MEKERSEAPRFATTLIRSVQSADRAHRCAIAVMAKASAPGLVKTRLSPPLTPVDAAALNSAFLVDVAANLHVASLAAPIDTFMAFGPIGAAPFFEKRFGAEVGLIEVWHRDFGVCLFETMRTLFALGYGAACVLNSDSPTLPTARLIEAAHHLAKPGDRAVLGPSMDGGYYLLGLKAPRSEPFETISWSTEVVAQQTRARIDDIGLDLVELDPWFDVDDEATLHTLRSQISGRCEASAEAGFSAPATVAFLATLDSRGEMSQPPYQEASFSPAAPVALVDE